MSICVQQFQRIRNDDAGSDESISIHLFDLLDRELDAKEIKRQDGTQTIDPPTDHDVYRPLYII